MNELNRGTRIYVLATIAAALGVLAYLLSRGPIQLNSQFITLVVIGAAMAPHAVHFGMRVEMSIAHPFILATMILLGESEAVVVAAICITSLCVFRTPSMATFRTLFNISSFVVTTFVTCEVYRWSGGYVGGPRLANPVVALMLATLVFYLANTYSISGVVALSNRLNLFRVWKESFLWSAPSFFAGGSLALGMSYFLDRFGIYAFILSLPFCVLIYYSYKLYLDKLEEKRQHLQDIELMNADLERKVRERTHQLQIVNVKLQESNMELKRASSLKSEFLANMSHELRTPLNAIIGFSELLMDPALGTLNEDHRGYASDIHNSGRHLLGLINDILDLSKIEAGKMRLSVEKFDLGPVVDEAMALLRVEAGRKQIDLTARIDGGPIEVEADRSKVKQILYNLLSNAVKFTQSGGRVVLSAGRTGDLLMLEVSDTGIGISEEYLTRIFQAFTQVDGSYARQYQGTGLGLTLVKKFVEMHGGRVRARSQPGVGSTFGIVIPLRVAVKEDGDRTSWPTAAPNLPDRPAAVGFPAPAARPGAAAEPDDPPPGDAALILVVEDNPSNMKLVCELLRAQGYRVDGRDSGEAAIDALKSLRPRLILMDIQLPGMDGLEVARILKMNPETSGIPVVALTAHVMQGDESRAREAGCVGYIPKPIERTRFAQQIADFLKPGRTAAAR